MAKRIITSTFKDGIITTTFDGEEGYTLYTDINDLSDDIREAAMVYGIIQKLGDAGALPKNPITGEAPTTAMKFEAVRGVHERLTSADGTWNATTRTGGGMSRGALELCEAIQMVYPTVTRESIIDKLAALDGPAKRKLRGQPAIQKALAEIALKRAETSDDNGTLSEFMADEPDNAEEGKEAEAEKPKRSRKAKDVTN